MNPVANQLTIIKQIKVLTDMRKTTSDGKMNIGLARREWQWLALWRGVYHIVFSGNLSNSPPNTWHSEVQPKTTKKFSCREYHYIYCVYFL